MKIRLETVLQDFGDIVRDKRLEMKLTQRELAKLSGFHFTYIGRLELGKTNISLMNIKRLADAFECTLKDLMP